MAYILYDVRTHTDPDIREAICDNSQTVAILPVGSIEQHGSHLPTSTDTDIAAEISRRLALRNNYLLLPPIHYGVSYEHAPRLNISISNETLAGFLSCLCMSLYANKIDTVFVINGHHGNQEALKLLKLPKSVDDTNENKIIGYPTIHTISYWHYMQEDLGHAGFVETSIMLAISDIVVKMDRAKKGLITDGMSAQQKTRLADIASTSFMTATPNGIWGDPTGATKQDGLRILSDVTERIGSMCDRLITNGI